MSGYFLTKHMPAAKEGLSIPFSLLVGYLYVLFIILVPSIHNIYKNQMYKYNWVISGDMFRPLNGHPQANN